HSIVLADEAVVLEPQETESLTTEQKLNQNDEDLAIEQSLMLASRSSASGWGADGLYCKVSEYE
ncbi:MAG: hypothetical protein LUG56_07570, partial [Lachnospiraceae bacterium]|nr:hypothetical protein [Lachnospiraceae bacterium]